MSDSEIDDYDSNNDVLDFSQLWRALRLLQEDDDDDVDNEEALDSESQDTENDSADGIVLELSPLPPIVPVEAVEAVEAVESNESLVDEANSYDDIMNQINIIRNSLQNSVNRASNRRNIEGLDQARNRNIELDRSPASDNLGVEPLDRDPIRQPVGSRVARCLFSEHNNGDNFNRSEVAPERQYPLSQLRNRSSNSLRSRWTTPSVAQPSLPIDHISNRVIRPPGSRLPIPCSTTSRNRPVPSDPCSSTSRNRPVPPVPISSTSRNRPVPPVPSSSTSRNRPVPPVPSSSTSRNRPVPPVQCCSTSRNRPVLPVPCSSTSRNRPVPPVPCSSTSRNRPVPPVPGSSTSRNRPVPPVPCCSTSRSRPVPSTPCSSTSRNRPVPPAPVVNKPPKPLYKSTFYMSDDSDSDSDSDSTEPFVPEIQVSRTFVLPGLVREIEAKNEREYYRRQLLKERNESRRTLASRSQGNNSNKTKNFPTIMEEENSEHEDN